MEIVFKSVKELIPYVNNTRTHNEKQVKQIASSIKEFGFNNPILIDAENEVIAGHGRLLASELLNMEEVPCIVLGHLTKAQKKAYVIADNRLAELASWDKELLEIELESLRELDFNLDILGFDDFDESIIFDEWQLDSPTSKKEKQENEKKCKCPACGFEF